jgi:hypothetical protein
MRAGSSADTTRLDVIEDASAPGGYRIEGTLRLPIVFKRCAAERKRPLQGEPNQGSG